MTLIVTGKVRRGELTALCDLLEVATDNVTCDECERPVATHILLSKRGLATFVCDYCLVKCSEPTPSVVDGVVCDTVGNVRRAIVDGKVSHSLDALRSATNYEAAKKKWDKATTPHGYFHKEAKPKPNDTSGINTWFI